MTGHELLEHIAGEVVDFVVCMYNLITKAEGLLSLLNYIAVLLRNSFFSTRFKRQLYLIEKWFSSRDSWLFKALRLTQFRGDFFELL